VGESKSGSTPSGVLQFAVWITEHGVRRGDEEAGGHGLSRTHGHGQVVTHFSPVL